jgi:hypothetical protein
MPTKLIINGKEQHVVHGMFGEAARNILDQLEEGLTPPVDDVAEMYRFFETEAEANAYLQGLADMSGWLDYEFTTTEQHQKLFADLLIGSL